jgi:hypothetical protein
MMNAGGTVSGYLERERKEAAQGKSPTWTTGELREGLAPCVSQILSRHSARAEFGTHVRNLFIFLLPPAADYGIFLGSYRGF